MRVVDIFCGAGGFSEGFRQAGFEIILGIDKWEPAVNTHNANHPGAITLQEDVLRISCLPDDEFHRIIPDSEIIIGSPPCVSFSNSNRSGNGDKSEGVELIKAYLRLVARKKWSENSKLKYWILENVPNSSKYINSKYSAADLGLEGTQELIVKSQSSKVYNAVYFGVPSRRKRFFCGEFPEPHRIIEKKGDIVHLKDVLDALGKPYEKTEGKIIDPNFQFELPGSVVTDHHYTQKLARFQWKTAKRLKQDKGYMGKMAFPEDLARPARTIMATMTFGARESMIFDNGKNSYRAPTIREVATLMSFPIEYNFYGESLGTKYRLVGNAVPPKMAFAIATEIAQNEGLIIPETYKPLNNSPSERFINLNGTEFSIRQERAKHPRARYKYHIPYLKVDQFRVELTNHHSQFETNNFRWDVEIHYSQGPRANVFTPSLDNNLIPITYQKIINSFIDNLKNRYEGAQKFQEVYCLTARERKKLKILGPDELLIEVRKFLDLKIIPNLKNQFCDLKDEKITIPAVIYIGYFILRTIITQQGDN